MHIWNERNLKFEKDWGRKEISEERRRKVKESDNDMTYKEEERR